MQLEVCLVDCLIELKFIHELNIFFHFKESVLFIYSFYTFHKTQTNNTISQANLPKFPACGA